MALVREDTVVPPPGGYTAAAVEAEAIRREDVAREKAAKEWSYGPSLSSWLGDSEPDESDAADWHIRGLVPQAVPFMIGGDPKTGKTMLMESWAIALAMGAADWCGATIAERRRVLLMPREDAERTTKARVWQLARGAGLRRPHELEEWLSIDPHNPLDMGNADHTARLTKACERFDVIFIDSFATSHHGDENSVRDMSSVMGTSRDLSLGTKTAIGFIHHFNGKGGPSSGEADKRSPIHRLRGSSAIAGYARHVVGVERGKDKGQVVIASDGNFEYRPDPFVVRLVNELREDKRVLRYELVGDAQAVGLDAEDAQICDAIVAVLRRSTEGLRERDLRTLVSDHLKDTGLRKQGVRGARVSDLAEKLLHRGRIDRENDAPKRWRSASGTGHRG